MNNIIFAIISILWLIIAIFDYSEFCYFWQLKEYRRDKFLDFLSTTRGKDFLKGYLVIGRFLVFILAVLFWILGKDFSVNIFALLLVAECIRYAVKYFKRNIRRPKVTIKALLIILLSIGVELIVWKFAENINLLLLLFGVRILVISFVVVLFYAPTKILKKIYVILATRKLKKYSKLKVIGATGSYGKTTVKNFLTQILGANFRVVATPKNINTEIGVAKFILQTDFANIDIFVVEMGAYKKGEIGLICEMVSPEIGVLTAINEQHVSLFGSIQNIQAAKYELLFSLPKNGLAIVNLDNQYTRELLSELNCKVKTFGRQKEFEPSCYVEKVATDDNQAISFACSLEDKTFEITAPVVGEHNAMNISPCIIVADYLKITKEKIIESAKKLKLPKGTLKAYSYGNIIIIDDSYNANPDGFLAALDVLSSYPGELKKIVITRGMLELGERSSELHQKIGKRISEVADELIIISNDNEKDLRIGAGDIKVKSIYAFDELLKYVKSLKNDKVVILLENRVSDNVMRELGESSINKRIKKK